LVAFDYNIIEELAEELLVNDKIEFSEEKLVYNKINKITKENNKIELSEEEKLIYGKIIEEKLVLEIELAEKTLNNMGRDRY